MILGMPNACLTVICGLESGDSIIRSIVNLLK